TGFAGSGLREYDFSCAALADGNRSPSQHSGHLVVGGIEVFFFGHQHLAEKQIDDSRSRHTTEERYPEAHGEPYRPKTREQIAGSAEPCQECGKAHEVEGRDLAAFCGGRMSACARPMNRMR